MSTKPLDEEAAGGAPKDPAIVADAELKSGADSMQPSATSDPSLGGRLTAMDEAEAAAEKRLVRKLDFTIYPILFVVYMLSFLDRINISNARIQGLTEDLHLTGNRFNIALFVRRPSPLIFVAAS